MYTLGYDIGSSFIKASIVDVEKGTVVAKASYPEKEMLINSLRSGWAEQDPAAWWKAVKGVTDMLASQATVSLQDVRAIGISYQMHGLVLVDKDGLPLRPSIIWCDSRAVPYGQKAFEEIGSEKCLSHLLHFIFKPTNCFSGSITYTGFNQNVSSSLGTPRGA